MYPANSPYDGSPFPLKRGASRPQAWSEFADPAANYGFHPRPRYHRNPNYAPARTPTWSEFADPAANYGFHPRPRLWRSSISQFRRALASRWRWPKP
ncbi:hypothetical protein LINGRAHAP2_LOCUS33486, partial [Linum grandiflorum]